MCLWRNLWSVKCFPPSPDGGSPCSHIDWNSIKPAQLRNAAIRAVCNQIIYQNYGTLKRKFRNSLFNSILSSDFDGTKVITPVVSYAGHHEVIYVVGQSGWNPHPILNRKTGHSLRNGVFFWQNIAPSTDSGLISSGEAQWPCAVTFSSCCIQFMTGTVHADRYMYSYDNISLNSSQNEKRSTQIL